MARGSCCVVETKCKAPANVRRLTTATKCYACGEFVCSNCSSMRKWCDSRTAKRRRICNNCWDQEMHNR